MINRLIILGNGFDLAHGLKTSYKDFLEDYYSKIKNSDDWKDKFYECAMEYFAFENCKTINEIVKSIQNKFDLNNYKHPNTIFFKDGSRIIIKNLFFFNISQNSSIQNWVDIENEYYKNLLNIIDKVNLTTLEDSKKEQSIKIKITRLNKEMDQIANEFEKYLKNNVKKEIPKKRNPKMMDIIKNQSPDINYPDTFFDEFPLRYSNALQANFRKNILQNYILKKYNKTVVLNFNYTNTFASHYDLDNKDITSIINIHGEIGNLENPINLGFGDEMSNRYSEIEDLNENEYLRLMKSFAYSNNTNYKNLIDFIESEEFQVVVCGHSCGLSDRTLLNSVFQNPNCKSIKVYYYENNNGNNYSELVMNISRHFSKKALMREKIVNKDLCKPLPQIRED